MKANLLILLLCFTACAKDGKDGINGRDGLIPVVIVEPMTRDGWICNDKIKHAIDYQLLLSTDNRVTWHEAEIGKVNFRDGYITVINFWCGAGSYYELTLWITDDPIVRANKIIWGVRL